MYDWEKWYIEWVEDMWNKCPNCDWNNFDIIHRQCLDCWYTLEHITLQNTVKQSIEETRQSIWVCISTWEDPYDSRQKGFLEDRQYF